MPVRAGVWRSCGRAKIRSATSRPPSTGLTFSARRTRDSPPPITSLLDAALRRGTRGLIESVRLAHIPPGDNVLIVVDQFEELFRFKESHQIENSRDEAAAFVKLLLEATSQEDVPIYVVLTMRADFIGDCMEYHGLPEALNASQYLVPRLTRDELRAAITGPVAVGGGDIAPRLVLRLLNDLGERPGPAARAAARLMRTWDYWAGHHAPGEPIDIRHYDAVGTMQEALSRHAEEAYAEVGSGQKVAERVFKALTDTVSDPRGIRRPCSVAALAAIGEVPEADVIRIVEVFRRPGRSFLMPPSDEPLDSHAIVDLSHESLMRCWTRLITWADEERVSASIYVRLARAAAWFEEGSAGLWRDPELELGLRWRRENRPTAAWANRYDPSFDRAMRFFARSEEDRDREKADRVAMRRKQWRRLQLTALGLAALLAYAVWNGIVAQRATDLAEKNNDLAQQNLRDAVRAVDESLALIDRDPGELGIDHPDVIAIRSELAERARAFYVEFINRGFADETLRQSVALAHFRLGQANRVLEKRDEAVAAYTQAIEQFSRLKSEFPKTPHYRQDLANSYTYLGETLRPSRVKYDDAKKAYDTALDLQRALVHDYPDTDDYGQDLARTYYNRGILHSMDGGDDASRLAEADFREAIRLLEPLTQKGTAARARQELARVFNNLGTLLANAGHPLPDVERLYARAVSTHEALSKSEPANREYRMELAKFYNNLASIQRDQGLSDRARETNERALVVTDALGQAPPTLAIEQVDGHNVRGLILQSRGWRDAVPEYAESLRIFKRLGQERGAIGVPDYHLRYGELLDNLASLVKQNPGIGQARQLLIEAIGYYLATCEAITMSGGPDEAESALDNMSRLLKELDERDRATVDEVVRGARTKVERSSNRGG